MLIKRLKWIYLVAVIVVAGISMLASHVFAETKGGATREGIKVHGHWKIEIFNPDGKRVSTTEFDNTYWGGLIIPSVLTGQWAPGPWGIALDATTGNKPCDYTGSPSECWIGESGAAYQGMTLHSTNLTVNVVTPSSIVLSGSVTASNASTIDRVKSTFSFCQPGNDVTSSSCRTSANNVFFDFTGVTLTTPPSVVPGQLIQVTVTISFS